MIIAFPLFFHRHLSPLFLFCFFYLLLCRDYCMTDHTYYYTVHAPRWPFVALSVVG